MIRRPPRSTQSRSSAASDVYKRQVLNGGGLLVRQRQPYAGAAGSSLNSLLSIHLMPIPNHETMTGGITCIDTGYYRPRMAACYLMEHNGQAAFIDTGTAHSVPRLLKLLDHKQIARH